MQRGESLADQVHAAMHAAIRERRLAPGQKVTERDLAAQMGVSPTPVREALRQLVKEGMVHRTDSRTLRIAEYTDEARVEITEIETRLSALAARFAARNADTAALEALAVCLRECDEIAQSTDDLGPEQLDSIFGLLRRFHRMIETAAGNSVLVGLLDQARAFSEDERRDLTTKHLVRDRVSIEHRYREHHRLLEAIARGDEDAAEALALSHHSGSARELRD